MSTRKYAPFLAGVTALLISATASAQRAPNGRDPRGSIDTDGLPHIIYVGAYDRRIYEISLMPDGRWRWADLTRLSAGPLVRTNATAMAYPRSDGLTSVVYIGENDHIMELYAGTRWRTRDVTVDAGLTAGPVSDPVGYRRSDNKNAIVFQADNPSRGDIHELIFSSGHWRDNNVTTAMSMPKAYNPQGPVYWHPSFAAVDGRTMIPYTAFSGSNLAMVIDFSPSTGRWAFRNALNTINPTIWARADDTTALTSVRYDGHLLLQRFTGVVWTAPTDLSSSIGAPPVSGTPVGFKRADGIDSIVYITAFNPTPLYHIEEVAFWGGAWHKSDLTAATGALPPVAFPNGAVPSQLYPYDRDGVTAVSYTNGDDIYELYYYEGWHNTPVSAIATPQ